MEINEIINSIDTELKKLGIEAVENTSLISTKEIYTLKENLEDINNLEELINKLTNYNAFLRYKKALYESKFLILESEFNRKLYAKTRELSTLEENRFLVKEEKYALALNLLKKDYENFIFAKSLLTRIKDVPYIIEKKIEFLRAKYYRMVNEKREY